MKTLIEQLKERKIWRTLVAYPSVSFVLLQAVEFFGNNYGLDSRLLSATVIACVGFLPVALLWNWFHGESGHQPFRKPEIIFYILVSAATLSMVGWYWNSVEPAAPVLAPSAQPARSIAVMPFLNPGEDAQVQYLCDGIAESLINWLAAQDEVRVSSKSASFRLRAEQDDPIELGRRLGVDSVIQGRLERVGDQVVISASMVDTRDGSQIWGERLSRPDNEILALERSIVEAITTGLSLNVTGPSETGLGGTESDEAYRHYLRGHYLIQATSGEVIDEGLEELRAAIRIDPAFGLPYAGMADAMVQKIFYTIDRTDESVGEARTAARTAVALAPGLAESHTALAAIHVYFDYDWTAGEEAYEAAIALNPGSPAPYYRYADFLLLMLQFDRAIEMARKALEIDPLDASSLHGLGFAHMLAGNDEQSVEAFRDWNQFHPQSTWSYVKYAVMLARSGQCELALERMDQAEQRTGGRGSPLMQSWMAWAYHLCDAQERYGLARQRILKASGDDGLGEAAAVIWLALIEDDADTVIRVMQDQLRKHSDIVPFFAAYGLESNGLKGTSALREDPRYLGIIKELKFPDSRWLPAGMAPGQ